MAALSTRSSLVNLQAARATNDAEPRASQLVVLAAFGPSQTRYTFNSQSVLLAAYGTEEENVSTRVSQSAVLAAYGTGIPGTSKSESWTFILDGHRFYVLPLGPEGTWAYDTTTKEWCKLRTDGYDGLNFENGVMWGIRVIGGDALYSYLYELDPNQPLDEGWRPVQHMTTGGIPTRSHDSIGVNNFTLTASPGLLGEADQTMSLAFSDDNGVTWSQEFELPLTGESTQTLLWPALGSFSSPGRVFRITDYAGPIRIDGADVELTASVEPESE